LEVTLLNQRKPEEYVRILYSVLEDVRELNQMSTSLLDLASVNQENAVFQKTSLRLDEILWEVRESVLTLNTNYKVDIHTITMPEEESKLYLLANPYLLKTALQNIIENACKFSNDHQATISLICTNEELEIRVFDNGPGIDKKEIQNIFQPFYRSNNTSKIKGHGIGLSLSQRIIAIHQGTIEIDSSLGEGTQVSVIFPVA
jgi:signal transduction histidine kinase